MGRVLSQTVTGYPIDQAQPQPAVPPLLYRRDLQLDPMRWRQAYPAAVGVELRYGLQEVDAAGVIPGATPSVDATWYGERGALCRVHMDRLDTWAKKPQNIAI